MPGAQLLKGRGAAAAELQRVRDRVADRAGGPGSAPPPHLALFKVGGEPAADQYLRVIRRTCEQVGVEMDLHALPSGTGFEGLCSRVHEAAADPRVNAVQILKPIPGGRHVSEVMVHVPPEKDVEGIHPENLGLLLLGRPRFIPCTAQAVILLLQHHGIELGGLKAVVIGRSDTVGKPLSALLLARHATVTVCHSLTRELREEVTAADLVVAAIGQPELVQASWIKPGAVVVDLGHHVLADGRTVGDVSRDARKHAGHVTPVPGGAGPITVAVLMSNIMEAVEAQERDRVP